MADTRVQVEIENWVRCEWLPQKFNRIFRSERMRLTPGGVFKFDAVSEDDAIVANISTSSSLTARGKRASAKLQKLRSDMLFLLMTQAEKRLIVLTEKDMYELCIREKLSGRIPMEIEFLHAELPADLTTSLRAAKLVASKEVTP